MRTINLYGLALLIRRKYFYDQKFGSVYYFSALDVAPMSSINISRRISEGWLQTLFGNRDKTKDVILAVVLGLLQFFCVIAFVMEKGKGGLKERNEIFMRFFDAFLRDLQEIEGKLLKKFRHERKKTHEK